MTKKKAQQEDSFENVEQVLTRTEQYIEDNQKSLTIILAVIIVVVVAYLGYTRMYIGPKEKDAQSQMFVAEQYFEKDSFQLALNGDGNYLGFLDIIDDYSMTKSGNLANYYAGVCYLNLGDYEMAIEYLNDFDADDQMVSPIALGATGDAYMELGNNEEAVKHYVQAANYSENKFTTPIYLMKAGQTYEMMGDFGKALATYERIEKEFPESTEGRQIEKYISRVKSQVK